MGLSESEQVVKLRAQVIALELKLREHITLAAAEDACKAARHKGAEEMRRELEPEIEQVLQSYDAMRLERQKAAQSAVEAWTEAQKLAALKDRESLALSERIQQLKVDLRQSRKSLAELSKQRSSVRAQKDGELKAALKLAGELTRSLSSDSPEPAGAAQEEEPVNMDHVRQFVVDDHNMQQDLESLRSTTPQPSRSKTPSTTRSKTPRGPRSKTPRGPRSRTPPEGGRIGRRGAGLVCSAPRECSAPMATDQHSANSDVSSR